MYASNSCKVYLDAKKSITPLTFICEFVIFFQIQIDFKERKNLCPRQAMWYTNSRVEFGEKL